MVVIEAVPKSANGASVLPPKVRRRLAHDGLPTLVQRRRTAAQGGLNVRLNVRLSFGGDWMYTQAGSEDHQSRIGLSGR